MRGTARRWLGPDAGILCAMQALPTAVRALRHRAVDARSRRAVDWHAEGHEQTMVAFALSSKRERTRTRTRTRIRIRVRTAMAAQTLEQSRYLGGARRTGTG